MYSYSQIFRQAFNIAIKNPTFWWFGIFLAMIGSAGEAEVFLGRYIVSGDNPLFNFLSGLSQGGFFTLSGILGLKANPIVAFMVIAFFLLTLGITVLFIWLIIISQSAIIAKAVTSSKGKELTARDGFTLGLMKFWPVLGLNVLIRVVATVFFFIAGVISLINFPGQKLTFVIVFLVLLLLTLAFSFVTKFAICGVILKNDSMINALKNAKNIFLRNWLISIELSIILFLVYVFVNSLLFITLSLIFVYSLKLFAGFVFGLYFTWLIILTIFTVVEVGLAIFYWSTWAIVFELLSRDKEKLSGFVAKVVLRKN